MATCPDLSEAADPPLTIATAAQSPPTCSICRTEAARYRCPAHPSIRTCSLACAKRHKIRTSCNGRRDPAVYLKRREVSTAAGIDRDFNFLTEIERAVGSGVDLGGPGGSQKRRRFDGAFERYCDEHRITVVRAPEGMSRAQTNESRFLQKSRKVAWTVEWIGVDGWVKRTEVLGDTTIEVAGASATGRKRKRCVGVPLKDLDDGAGERRSGVPDEEQGTDDPGPDTIKAGDDDQSAEMHAKGPAVTTVQAEEPYTAEAIVDMTGGHVTDRKKTQPPSIILDHSQTDVAAPYYYLRNPKHERLSRDKRKTTPLIGLSGTATLTDCLRGRTVEEYPTIYILPTAPADLDAVHRAEFNLDASTIHSHGIEVMESHSPRNDRNAVLPAARPDLQDTTMIGSDAILPVSSAAHSPAEDTSQRQPHDSASSTQHPRQHHRSNSHGRTSPRRPRGSYRGAHHVSTRGGHLFATGANRATTRQGSGSDGPGHLRGPGDRPNYDSGPDAQEHQRQRQVDRAALLDMLRRDVSR